MTMRQLTQNYLTGELNIRDIPDPAVGAGNVLVAVAASLVSVGTERTMVSLAQANLVGKAQQRPDLVRQVLTKVQQEGLLTTYQKVMNRLEILSPLGYSCAGVVMAVGAGVADLAVGDWVACAGAGYANHAEIVSVPRNLVARVPQGVSLEQAAFTTIGTIALQGVRQAAPTLGETIAVIGLGLMGQLTAQLLKASGCRVLGMDLDMTRCSLAQHLACEDVASGAEAFRGLCARWTLAHGMDAVIITASTKSNAPIELAAEICRDKGRIVAVGQVGLGIPRKPFYDKELDFRLSRSYGPGRYDFSYEEQGHDYPLGYVRWTENRNMQAFLDLVAQGNVNVEPLITHRFTIQEATAAYDLIMGDQSAQALGVILTYPGYEQRRIESERKVIRLDRREKASSHRVITDRVRLGLIGAGQFAQGTLLPALRSCSHASLEAVCSASGLSARHVAEKYGAAYCATDVARLLNDPDLTAVMIATRHGSHAALVSQALAVGKPVFVEKPLTVNEEQLADVARAYHTASKPSTGSRPPFLMVGFNRRFAPLSRSLYDFVQGRAPLMIHYRVNAGSAAPGSWLLDPDEGGGRIIGEVCHFIDLIQYLTDATPVEVYATRTRADRDTGRGNDDVIVHLRQNDGSVATIHYATNGDKAFPKERIEVFGGGGAAVLDDFRSLEIAFNGRSWRKRSLFQQDKGHRAELQAFIDAVRHDDPSPISFESLISTTLTTFRVHDALRANNPQPVIWSKAE